MKKLYWIFPLFLSLLVNFGVIGNGLVYDDINLFNIELPRFSTFTDPLFHHHLLSKDLNYYRPLVWWFFMSVRALGGQEPLLYHISLYIIHALNVILVTVLAGRFFSPETKRLGSVIAASFFAVYPIHVEVVAWISGAVDALLTTGFLASFICWLQYQKAPQKRGWLILSGLSFFLSLLAKETAVALMVLIVVHHLFARYHSDVILSPELAEGRRIQWHQLGWVWLAYFLPLIVYFALRYYNFDGLRLGFSAVNERLIIKGISAYGFYIKTILFPYPLNNFIDQFQPSLTFFSASIVMLISYLIFCWITWRRQPWICFHLIFFLLTISPACLLPLTTASYTPLAERYLYLPAYSLSYLLGHFLVFNFKEKKILSTSLAKGGVAILLLTLFSVMTMNRVKIWKNEQVFWKYAAQQNPHSFAALIELGRFLIAKGKCEKARDTFEQAMQKPIPSNYVLSIPALNLSLCYGRVGRYSEAEWFAQLALKMDPSAESFLRMGNTYILWATRTQEVKEFNRLLHQAKENCEKSFQMDPDNFRIFYCLGKVYEGLQEFSKARTYFKKVVAMSPPSDVVFKDAQEALKKIGPPKN